MEAVSQRAVRGTEPGCGILLATHPVLRSGASVSPSVKWPAESHSQIQNLLHQNQDTRDKRPGPGLPSDSRVGALVAPCPPEAPAGSSSHCMSGPWTARTWTACASSDVETPLTPVGSQMVFSGYCKRPMSQGLKSKHENPPKMPQITVKSFLSGQWL